MRLRLAVSLLAALGAASGRQEARPERTVPQTDPRVQKATAVKDRHMDALFKLPAVVGAGVGLSKDAPEKVVIQVFVSRKLKPREGKRFPKKLEGVPVEIVETGEFRALPAEVPPGKPKR